MLTLPQQFQGFSRSAESRTKSSHSPRFSCMYYLSLFHPQLRSVPLSPLISSPLPGQHITVILITPTRPAYYGHDTILHPVPLADTRCSCLTSGASGRRRSQSPSRCLLPRQSPSPTCPLSRQPRLVGPLLVLGLVGPLLVLGLVGPLLVLGLWCKGTLTASLG